MKSTVSGAFLMPGGFMARDDYEVIMYRILVYLYACMKRKIIFDKTVLLGTVCKGAKNEEYLTDVFRMIQDEGFLDGLAFTHTWCNDFILANDIENSRITPAGIRYLKENSRMKQIGEMFRKDIDTIANLANLIELF